LPEEVVLTSEAGSHAGVGAAHVAEESLGHGYVLRGEFLG
jgi:hypothetical protein